MKKLKEIFPPRASYAMLPVRLALFLTFFYHGTQNLFGWFGGGGLEGTAAFMGSLGVPLPKLAAFLLALVKTVGSIAFLVGAGTRLFSLLICGVMLAGIVLVHADNGWNFLTGGIEFNVALIGMCLTVLFYGPGAGSISPRQGLDGVPDLPGRPGHRRILPGGVAVRADRRGSGVDRVAGAAIGFGDRLGGGV